MKNKTILFLINGFGIQQKDCYDIFNNGFMQNLIDLSSRYLYTTIPTKSFDYKEGYSELSSGSNTSISYSNINNNIDKEEYKNNEKIKEIIEKSQNAKLQIFCFLDDIQTVLQIKPYIKYIYKNIKKKIILNIVLRQKDISQYKTIISCMDKISIDLAEEVTLGLVMGENKLNANEVKDYVRIMYTEITEIWHDSKSKFISLQKEEINPIDVKPFLINKGFKLENNDTLLFFNYNNFKIDTFLNHCEFNPLTRQNTILNYYTLFPIISSKEISSIYPSPTSEISLDKILKFNDINCLVVCEKEKINTINYYCNGYLNVISDNLSYGIIENNTNSQIISEYIKHKGYDFVIVNYHIDNTINLTSLKQRLTFIDNILKDVAGVCINNGYSLIISSLYGINEKLKDDNGVIRTINFSTKVPFILVDQNYNKVNYIIKEGTIHNIANTCCKIVNPSYVTDSLVVRKSKLSKMFQKK